MSKPSDYRKALRESMDRVDELLGFKNPLTFGQKTDPSDEEVQASSDRRVQDVKDRAGSEKKSYGFLRSLKGKMFGKKAPEPEFQRPERSEDERRAAVIDRAKNQQ